MSIGVASEYSYTSMWKHTCKKGYNSNISGTQKTLWFIDTLLPRQHIGTLLTVSPANW